jgi:PEP-CTERM motif
MKPAILAVLTLVASATVAQAASAADAVASHMTITGLSFAAQPLDPQSSESAIFVLSGPALRTHFVGGAALSSSDDLSASSSDGTRQVLSNAQGMVLDLQVSHQQLADAWQSGVYAPNSLSNIWGTQISGLVPSNYMVDGVLEPPLLTLSPRSAFTVSAEVSITNTVDAPTLINVLQSLRTDTTQPYFSMGSRLAVGGTIWENEPTEEEMAALSGSALAQIAQDLMDAQEPRAANYQSLWLAPDAPTGAFTDPITQSVRAVLVNPFDRPMTFKLDFEVVQEVQLFHTEVHASVVPEPGTCALMALGLVGLALVTRRRHAPT